jgi:hypothetical protein
MRPHVVEQHRLLAEPLVALRALEPELVVHVLVLVLEAVRAEHLAAEPAREALLVLGGVLGSIL